MSVSHAICPGCKGALELSQPGGVNLYGCASCGGIWLDNDGCARVAAAAVPDALTDAVRAHDADEARVIDAYRSPARAAGGARRCPWCGLMLERATIAGVELEACRAHGTFFDRHELFAVSQAIALKHAEDDLFVKSLKTYGRPGYFP